VLAAPRYDGIEFVNVDSLLKLRNAGSSGFEHLAMSNAVEIIVLFIITQE
jgi:hypothetical protein